MTNDEVLRGVLDQWKAGINAHEPQRVAEVFARDAIFQGLRPYSVGRRGVADYYDSEPRGMTVSYRILESRQPAPDVTFPDRPTMNLYIGALVERGDDGWRIGHYQASRLDDG